eukprot:1135959-Prorocentrum_minimum.AAC.1
MDQSDAGSTAVQAARVAAPGVHARHARERADFGLRREEQRGAALHVRLRSGEQPSRLPHAVPHAAPEGPVRAPPPSPPQPPLVSPPVALRSFGSPTLYTGALRAVLRCDWFQRCNKWTDAAAARAPTHPVTVTVTVTATVTVVQVERGHRRAHAHPVTVSVHIL